jgi:Rieske Fe-S protein
MKLTRRQFTAAASTTVALTVLGCSDKPTETTEETYEDTTGAPTVPGQAPGKLPTRIAAPTAAFVAGVVDDFRRPGVYDQHWERTGIYLFSDGERLVAISSVCTHNGCAVRWEREARRFTCPCHESLFDADGRLSVADQKAKEPLMRHTIRLIATDFGPQVEIDPTAEWYEQGPGKGWDDPKAFIDLTA